MLKIGLTGGIGSGKTTVAKIFETLGIPVYYADQQAKLLMQTNPVLMQAIKNHFGEAAYIEGKLNRSFLSEIVFQDKARLEQLNSLVHPFTIEDGKNWMKQQRTPYAIKEAALIFETGTHAEFDFIIGVEAPLSLRLARIMQRDNQTREQVLNRMDKQLDDSIKIKLCDFIVSNDEQQLLIPQVNAIDKKLRSLGLDLTEHE